MPPERHFLVAGSRPWCGPAFETLAAHDFGAWKFITDPEGLTMEYLSELQPEILFFLHWSHRVPATIVEQFECVGFHMTDLPYGRGGSPLQNLILRGHQSTMLSAFRMTAALDEGPIYDKQPLALDGRADEIYARAMTLAARMALNIARVRPTPSPQMGEPTFFNRRNPDDSQLPNAGALHHLYDFIRMLDADGYPRAFIEHGRFRLQFRNARLEGGCLHASVEISEAKIE